MTKRQPTVPKHQRTSLINLILSFGLLFASSWWGKVEDNAQTLLLGVTVEESPGTANLRIIDHYVSQARLYSLKQHQTVMMSGNGIVAVTTLGDWNCRSFGINSSFHFLKLIGLFGSPGSELQTEVGQFWSSRITRGLFCASQVSHCHKTIGKSMKLFETSAGSQKVMLWYQRGISLIERLKDYARSFILSGHYIEVNTPMLMPSELWVRSGHAENYGSNMFNIQNTKLTDDLIIKPMNCVGHICCFNQKVRSYRELPLRFAEFGVCHRREASGALHGILRSRVFHQDDAHSFCTNAQIRAEVLFIHKTLVNTYTAFGLRSITVRLSYPDCFGCCSTTLMLRAVLNEVGVPFEEARGDGAFYGVKLEYIISDGIGRLWQCGTLQLDKVLPRNMGLSYISSDGRKNRPIIIHRAIFGSIERFIGILVETHSRVPIWLSPVPMVLLIMNNQLRFGAFLLVLTRKKNLVSEEDSSNTSIGYKVNKHSGHKIPYILMIGKRESLTTTTTAREFKSLRLRTFTVESLLYLIALKIKQLGIEEEL